MQILIDGYNLMFEFGLLQPLDEPGALRQARDRLLSRLVEWLGAQKATQTTIVFDAKRAPANLADEFVVRGIQVRFARGHDEADDLIEELIRVATAPQRLLIVSSDHRIQRAAKRRRARIIDCDEWLMQLEHPARTATENRPSSSAETEHSRTEKPEQTDSDWGPFPPGYGEDLLG